MARVASCGSEGRESVRTRLWGCSPGISGTSGGRVPRFMEMLKVELSSFGKGYNFTIMFCFKCDFEMLL